MKRLGFSLIGRSSNRYRRKVIVKQALQLGAVVISIVLVLGVMVQYAPPLLHRLADKAEEWTGALEEMVQPPAPVYTPTQVTDYKLVENKEIYADDDPTSVVTMYLTVRPGNASESSDHTWTEVNTYDKYYYEDEGIDRYKVEAILQVGDENGPLEGEVGYGAVIPNATVQIRGQTSSRNDQKGYKVELKEGMGTWRGQRTINLNKHQGERLRFRNKLAYDLMKDIPYMTACRTQFVHLYVKDETAGGKGKFEDYGLFTQVEQINKAYLKARDLDPNGQLYKIEMFEYYMYEDAIRLANDADYDKTAFEDVMEIKGDEDHYKLLQMLKEVNDYSIPIEDTVEKWFDTENLFYWMGFHILMGNDDTNARNYFLYSPCNVDKFYIMSWDNDGSLRETEQLILNEGYQSEGDWEYGISNYWGNVLYSRMFKEQKYRDGLTAAIEDLRASYLTDEKVEALTEKYKQVVKPYVYRNPDIAHVGLTQEQYEEVADHFASDIETNYQRYFESLEKPMPFFIGVPEVVADNKLYFTWGNAYDFDNEEITYSLSLARDYRFKDLIYQDNDVKIPGVVIDSLPEGTYYLRVIATNKSGYSQYAFDYLKDPDYGSTKIFGTIEFRIDADGTVSQTDMVE